MKFHNILIPLLSIALNFSNLLATEANKQFLPRSKFEALGKRAETGHQLFIEAGRVKAVKRFKSMDDLLASRYFQNHDRLKDVYITIDGSESLFDIVPYAKEQKTGDIVLRELAYGQKKKASLLQQPITKPSTSLSRTGAISIQHSNTLSRSFTHVHGFQVSADYSVTLRDILTMALADFLSGIIPGLPDMSIGINAAVGVDKLVSDTQDLGGTITCNTQGLNSTQLFVSVLYVYYPESKVRYHVYKSKSGAKKITSRLKLLDVTPWENVYTGQDNPELGLVFYDEEKGIQYACVDKEEYIQRNPQLKLKIFDPQYEPVEGLKLALAATD